MLNAWNLKLLPLKHASHLYLPLLSPNCVVYTVCNMMELSRIPSFSNSQHSYKNKKTSNEGDTNTNHNHGHESCTVKRDKKKKKNCICNAFAASFVTTLTPTNSAMNGHAKPITFVEQISTFLCVFGILGQTAYINRSKICQTICMETFHRNCSSISRNCHCTR